MKSTKQILIITLVILGFILLSNVFVIATLGFVLSPEGIFEGRNAAQQIHSASEIPAQRSSRQRSIALP